MRTGLLAVGIVLLLALGGCIYFHSQTPPLPRKPLAGIDLHRSEYHASINDPTLCEGILSELCQARRALAVAHWAGDITFRFADGSTSRWFMTINRDSFWIGGSRVFNGDARRLRTLLSEGGADVSKIADE